MKFPLSFLLLSLCWAPAAFSSEMRHDFVEVHYFQGEVEDDFSPADFDGWELRGSRAFGRWTVIASHEDMTAGPFAIDFFGLSADISRTTTRAGGGYVFPVLECFEIQPVLGVVRTAVDTAITGFCEICDLADQSESDTGYFVALGFRSRLGERFELEFNHQFTNVLADRLNDQRMDLRFDITETFAASIGYRNLEGDKAVNAAVRWHF